jgi:uncharacterized protein
LKLLLLLAFTAALEAQPKRVLYVTHSAGYRHDSIEISKLVLAELAAKSGKFEVVSTEDLSAISEASLREFDAVFFFTSGNLALSATQKAALLTFVQNGKGFGGVHSATDTSYDWPEYGDLIGAYFDSHPWVQEVAINVETPRSPIVRHLAPSFRITDEIYQFRFFSRERARVLLSLDNASVGATGDFPLAWTRSYSNGRVFYTALGHFDETWLDPRFQTMLSKALLWLTGQSEARSRRGGGSPGERGRDISSPRRR